MRVRARLQRRRLNRTLRRASAEIARRKALAWHRVYAARYSFQAWFTRRGGVTVAIIILALIGITAFWIPWLQGRLEVNFESGAWFDLLRSLFLALGGALIGAAAIVSSLLLLAMQVNIERMPHGLFRRLSVDRRLLSAFAATYLFAITIAALSLVTDHKQADATIYAAPWSTIIILAMFLYGYRRALHLVNPV